MTLHGLRGEQNYWNTVKDYRRAMLNKGDRAPRRSFRLVLPVCFLLDPHALGRSSSWSSSIHCRKARTRLGSRFVIRRFGGGFLCGSANWRNRVGFVQRRPPAASRGDPRLYSGVLPRSAWGLRARKQGVKGGAARGVQAASFGDPRAPRRHLRIGFLWPWKTASTTPAVAL